MKRSLLLTISFALVAFILSGLVLDRVVAAREVSYKVLSNFSESLDLVQKNYVEPAELQHLMEGAFRGLAETFDPGTYYLNPEALKRYRAAAPRDSAGIGAEISKRHGYALVLSVWDGGPAAGQLSPGDYIRHIDGASTREMSVFDIGERLRGAAGSEVKLKVVRREDMDTREISLKRAVAEPLSFARKELPDDYLLYRLQSIDDAAIAALERDLREASEKSVKGVLLDLRACARGRVADGARLADLFIDSGTLLRVYGRVGEDKVKAALTGLGTTREETRALPVPAPEDKPEAAGAATPASTPRPPSAEVKGYEYRLSARPETTRWKGPLVVLLDIGSVGAAEVAAAALQDAERATLVGARSFGGASFSDLVALEDGAALHITIARALAPRGRSLVGRGIEPDQLVEPAPAASATDPVIEKALEQLKADGRVKKAA